MLMDATVATGAAAMMAIRVLLDHDVPEENITLLSLLMAESGLSCSLFFNYGRIKFIFSPSCLFLWSNQVYFLLKILNSHNESIGFLYI